MDFLVLGNIVMFIGAILMSIIGLLKNKKTIIVAQTGQIALMSVGSLMLGSIPGAIVNLLSIIRNLLCYKGKLNKRAKIILLFFMIVISGLFNNLGAVGFLPIIATVALTAFMDTENVVELKWLLIMSSFLWMIHDAYIQAYSVLPFDILTIATNLISLRTIQKKQLCPVKENASV